MNFHLTTFVHLLYYFEPSLLRTEQKSTANKSTSQMGVKLLEIKIFTSRFGVTSI